MITTRSVAPSCSHQAYLKGSQGSKATKPSMQQGRKAKGDSCFSRLMFSVQKVYNVKDPLLTAFIYFPPTTCNSATAEANHTIYEGGCAGQSCDVRGSPHRLLHSSAGRILFNFENCAISLEISYYLICRFAFPNCPSLIQLQLPQWHFPYR